MAEPLEEQYFKWLYSQVASVRMKNPARTWWSLLRQLHTKEFVWLVANDDNRMEDGLNLRYEFLDQVGEEGNREWMSQACSMLEMMITLARRLEFESMTRDGVDDWFWQIMQNIGLFEYNDLYFKSRFTVELVDRALDTVIWRRYEPNGSGGLFPLQDPHQDQSQIELWSQMASYLSERE
jgi:hypothetical protein